MTKAPLENTVSWSFMDPLYSVVPLLSASKVRWPELSQLSLCSEFDKENSIEFSLISLLLIHFTTVAMCLLSYGPHVTLVIWHPVTVTRNVTIRHTIVTLWQSHVILSRTLLCSCESEKRKKKKRNINNDLAVLPSHDTCLHPQHRTLWVWCNSSVHLAKLS